MSESGRIVLPAAIRRAADVGSEEVPTVRVDREGIPFDATDADAASALYAQTKAFGLSLGDRACLAPATRQQATVWTADKVWKKLKVDVPAEWIRISVSAFGWWTASRPCSGGD